MSVNLGMVARALEELRHRLAMTEFEIDDKTTSLTHRFSHQLRTSTASMIDAKPIVRPFGSGYCNGAYKEQKTSSRIPSLIRPPPGYSSDTCFVCAGHGVGD